LYSVKAMPRRFLPAVPHGCADLTSPRLRKVPGLFLPSCGGGRGGIAADQGSGIPRSEYVDMTMFRPRSRPGRLAFALTALLAGCSTAQPPAAVVSNWDSAPLFGSAMLLRILPAAGGPAVTAQMWRFDGPNLPAEFQPLPAAPAVAQPDRRGGAALPASPGLARRRAAGLLLRGPRLARYP